MTDYTLMKCTNFLITAISKVQKNNEVCNVSLYCNVKNAKKNNNNKESKLSVYWNFKNAKTQCNLQYFCLEI